MFAWRNPLVAVIIAIGLATAANAAPKKYGHGRVATDREIAGWNIDVRPDGQGAPVGKGSSATGEDLYLKKCASCHGEFGEAKGRYPVLVGGYGSLKEERPEKTVGSYWPYASTLFDYVKRAMPFGQAQTLTDNEVYAITAYILEMNEVIPQGKELNQTNLGNVKMPNAVNFIADNRPDGQPKTVCMINCKASVKIIGRAKKIDVTPEREKAKAEPAAKPTEAITKSQTAMTSVGDPTKGKKVFNKCRACHTANKGGKNKLGPNLFAVVGRKCGSVPKARHSKGYKAACKKTAFSWTDNDLKSYLRDPSKHLSNVAGKKIRSSMSLRLRKDEEIADVIAYLKSLDK